MQSNQSNHGLFSSQFSITEVNWLNQYTRKNQEGMQTRLEKWLSVQIT